MLSRRQWFALAAVQAVRRPNVIWLIAADVGWDQIQTLHIKRLAAQGITFTSAYAGSADPAISRACLLTGRHVGHLQPGAATVDSVLAAAGYVSGFVGEWGSAETPVDKLTAEALRFIRVNRWNPFFLQIAYAGPGNEMDQSIGEIVGLINRLQLASGTLIIFAGTGGNGDLHEGGIRVPMIARWPARITPGAATSEPVAFWDLLPTAAEAASAPLPKDLDGISLVPLLSGKQTDHPRAYLYWESQRNGFRQAVREGQWKAIRTASTGALELFDLSSEAGESRDVAAGHPDLVKRLTQILDSVRPGNEKK